MNPAQNNTTRPIDAHLDTEEHFLTLSASHRPIVRVNVEDHSSLYSAISLLNGIIAGELSMDEVKRVRDILMEVVGS